VVDEKEHDLNVGDHVRISKGTLTEVKKNKFSKGINQNWSRRIYTVISVNKPEQAFQRPWYTLEYKNRVMSKKYFASQLMKVDIEKLIKDINPLEERPDYKPEIFNQEAHISELHKREVIELPIENPVKSPEVAPVLRRSTRERKKPERLTF